MMKKIKLSRLSAVAFVSLGLTHAYAWNLHDLWNNKNIEAMRMMKQGQFTQAFETFEQQDWKATAAYRAKKYQEAATLYGLGHTADSYYNQGNALAQMGEYPQALVAFKKALSIEPQHADALHNKKIMEDLLKKKQDQKKSSSQNKDQKQDNAQKQQNSSDKTQQNNKKDKQQQQQQQQQNKSSSQKKQEQTSSSQKKHTKSPSDASTAIQTAQKEENEHMKKHWLSLIPDDPGAFLREKFLRDYLEISK